MFRTVKNLVRRNKNKQPNVVIVLLDQFRSDVLDTHKIFDKLKEKGAFFSKAITYAPYTLASCHATFTGMYGRDNGVDAYTKSHHFDSKNCFTISDYLKAEGYFTCGYTFSSILIPHNGFDELNIITEDEETDITANQISLLDRCYSKKSPFFAYLHYGEIHHDVVREVIKPFSIDDERYFGESNLEVNKARYRKYAEKAGEYLEKIVKFINEKDKDNNTIVIVMTDHGSSNGEKVGEKAYGSFTYDYSIKVWYYFIFPKIIKPGTIVDAQVRTIDILPTILDLIGIPVNKRKKKLLGESLLPIITGENNMDRIAYSETGGVDGPYPSPDSPNIRCITDGKWKLIHNVTTNKFELYNLSVDPNETENLYSKETAQSERLWQEMIQYI